MISGYKIIDFHGTDLALSDNAYAVKGIYAAVTENYGKTTVVSNVKITGKKIDNTPVLFTSNSDGSLTGMVTIEVAADENTKTGVYLTIKPDDTVVYHTANFSGGGGVTPTTQTYTVKIKGEVIGDITFEPKEPHGELLYRPNAISLFTNKQDATLFISSSIIFQAGLFNMSMATRNEASAFSDNITFNVYYGSVLKGTETVATPTEASPNAYMEFNFDTYTDTTENITIEIS